jgi:alanine racemase
MARPTSVQIDAGALLHNLTQVKRYAPHCKVIAMIKANAYGCGLSPVVSILEGHVDAFGVACIEEAMAIRALGARTECVLFQGIFCSEELQLVAANNFQCVIHQPHQLQWLLNQCLPHKIKIWVKVNTGMHRLGFAVKDIYEIMIALMKCPWVDPEIGLITHLACADEPDHPSNEKQLQLFYDLKLPEVNIKKSISNSAAIMALPHAHAQVVRPGIMLYGVSPFANQTGQNLGLRPVMRFVSAISAIHHYPAKAPIGYGGIWVTNKSSIIGVVAAGYGDGYPRHVAANAPVWINGSRVPIVGRVSMDMLTVDLSDHPAIEIGDEVELWGSHIPVETIASSAGTIAYELLCQFSSRARLS